MITDARSILVLIAITAWQQIVQLGPYVLVGVLMAALLGQLDLSRRLAWFGQSHPISILSAACVGSLSPLSTYGTVPLLLQLMRDGASPGPVLAFLIASSMLNPQLFLLILGGLGVRLALAQLAGILILSLIAGWIATKLAPAVFLHTLTYPTPPAPSRRFAWSRLARDVIRTLEWIGLTFVTGVILSAAIQALVPMQWVTWLMGLGSPAVQLRTSWLGVLAAGVLGVPLYTCGGSAVPVLSGLAKMGMSQSVALAFLLSGPATRATALAAMGSLLNRRALIAYVVYIVIGAAVMGWLLGQ